MIRTLQSTSRSELKADIMCVIQRIIDPKTTDDERALLLEQLNDVFDSLVLIQEDYVIVKLLEAYLNILGRVHPNFVTDHPCHRSRRCIFEMLGRIPFTDMFRPFVEMIIKSCINALVADNEDIGLLAVRLFSDIIKSYKPPFNATIVSFLQHVRATYNELACRLAEAFRKGVFLRVTVSNEQELCNTLNSIFIVTTAFVGQQKTSYQLLPKANMSLRVLQEMSSLVVLLYQCYREQLKDDISIFTPLVMKVLMVQYSQESLRRGWPKDFYYEFMSMLAKLVFILSYIAKNNPESIKEYGSVFVQTIMNIFIYSAKEMSSVHRDAVVSLRNILATDLRALFVPVVDKLLDENVLLRQGLTSSNSHRVIVYSLMADFIHHCRYELPMTNIAKASSTFCNVLHDENVTNCAVHVVACKLLLNVIDSTSHRRREENFPYLKMVENVMMVFITKVKNITRYDLPVMMKKRLSEIKDPTIRVAAEKSCELYLKNINLQNLDTIKEPFPVMYSSGAGGYNVLEMKSLIRTLVCAMKATTLAYVTLGMNAEVRTLTPSEVRVFVHYYKHILTALNIYNPQIFLNVPYIKNRTKEDVDVMTHLMGMFSLLHVNSVEDIFSQTIDYFMQRISENPALFLLNEALMTDLNVGKVYGGVLLDYLIGKMTDLGSDNQTSSLYTKLFRAIFETIGTRAVENQVILVDRLPQFIDNCIKYSLSSKDPQAYFLLLRHLFRSIGGGSHEPLYRQLLPVIPKLLKIFNDLQSSITKGPMKDLFIDLCLTIPVRLSTLLPHMQLLMDPLVSALNNSPSVGLRTLELCVDNLQPNFLYEYIQPINFDLVEPLWQAMNSSLDQTAAYAFRILGKLGGANRSMLSDYQTLKFDSHKDDIPEVEIYFAGYSKPISISFRKAIDTAVSLLKVSATELHYRAQSCELLKGYLFACIRKDTANLHNILQDPCFTHGEIPDIPVENLHVFELPNVRYTHRTVLAGLLISLLSKDLSETMMPTVISVFRHYTIIAVAQQAGIYRVYNRRNALKGTMDPLVMIDAIATVMRCDEQKYHEAAFLALAVILQTCNIILGSMERVAKLPLIAYIVDRICKSCFEKPWCAKLGGCRAIAFLFKRLGAENVYRHVPLFVKALLFIIIDLYGELSCGTVDEAKKTLREIIQAICKPSKFENSSAEERDSFPEPEQKTKAISEVTFWLTRHITNPNETLREEVMHLLQLLAQMQDRSVANIMETHKSILLESIIPNKTYRLHSHTPSAQIGIMEATTFCVSLTPPLFQLDVTVEDHKAFIQEIMNICDINDDALQKIPCYKSMSCTEPLRKSAIRFLGACHYVSSYRDEIMILLLKCLEREEPILQQTAFENLKLLSPYVKWDNNVVKEAMKIHFAPLAEPKLLTPTFAPKLNYIIQVYPSIFRERVVDQLIMHLRKLLEAMRTNFHDNDELKRTKKIISYIFNAISYIPLKPTTMEILSIIVLDFLNLKCAGSDVSYVETFAKVVCKYPTICWELYLTEKFMEDAEWCRFMCYVLKTSDGLVLIETFSRKPNILEMLKNMITLYKEEMPFNLSVEGSYRIRYFSLKILWTMIKRDDSYFPRNEQFWDAVLSSVCGRNIHQVEFINDFSVTGSETLRWKEPIYITKLLLKYFTIYKAPRVLIYVATILSKQPISHLPIAIKFRQFLENVFTPETSNYYYLFLKVSDLYAAGNITEEVLATCFQYIFLPCFDIFLERGQLDKCMFGPDGRSDSMFFMSMTKLMDARRPVTDNTRLLVQQFILLCVQHKPAAVKESTKFSVLYDLVRDSAMPKKWADLQLECHSLLLLVHLRALMPANRPFDVQLMRNLFRTANVEVRNLVNAALDLLINSLIEKYPDGYAAILECTMKALCNDIYIANLQAHVLGFIIKQYKAYYHIRNSITSKLVVAIQRLGAGGMTLDSRKMAIDLADIIVKWELMQINEGENERLRDIAQEGLKRLCTDSSPDVPLVRSASGELPPSLSAAERSRYLDIIINILLRISCQVNEISIAPVATREALSRRCIGIAKVAMQAELWPRDGKHVKFSWMDKMFCTPLNNVNNVNTHISNICLSLEFVTYVTHVVTNKEIVLHMCASVQSGIIACIRHNNSKIIRFVQAFLSRLTMVYPIHLVISLDGTMQSTGQCEKLARMYNTITEIITEGFAEFDKDSSKFTSTVSIPVMLLKACSISSPTYVDKFVMQILRCLYQASKDHPIPNNTTDTSATEDSFNPVDITCSAIELMKSRIDSMKPDVRRHFFVMVNLLIEKTQEPKVMKALCKTVEDWVVNAHVPGYIGPDSADRALIVLKMLYMLDRRFTDMLPTYSHLYLHIYKDQNELSELLPKIKLALLIGLRCRHYDTRNKYMEIFNTFAEPKLMCRLLFILRDQKWESMTSYYWLKHCLEFIFHTTKKDEPVRISHRKGLLPPITIVSPMSNEEDETKMSTSFVREELSLRSLLEDKPHIEILDTCGVSNNENIQTIVNKEIEFLNSMGDNKTGKFLSALGQVAHTHTPLAEELWLHIFPQIWNILNDDERSDIAREVPMFVGSGSHVIQKDMHPSVISTIVESFSRCSPPVYIKGSLWPMLAKTYNLWHRAALTLEEMRFTDFSDSPMDKDLQPAVMDNLADLYECMYEEDMMCGVWQKHAKYAETVIGLNYEQQGFFEQALGAYELVMGRTKEAYAAQLPPASIPIEHKLWENHWIRCSRELSHWEHLKEYAQTQPDVDPMLLLDMAWRKPDYTLMKQAISVIDTFNLSDQSWKLTLYKGYACVGNEQENQLHMVPQLVELASIHCTRQWRKLPPFFSNAHVAVLQAAHLIIELENAYQVRQTLLNHSSDSSPLNEMKAIVKCWSNRLPTVGDDLSHWNDIFSWRHHQYLYMSALIKERCPIEIADSSVVTAAHAMSANIINLGRIARKHNLLTVSLDNLNLLYNIPTVPIVNCFYKVRQQVKCYQQLAQQGKKAEVQQGIDAIDYTNMSYLTMEMTAEFLALKGMLLTHMGNYEEANKAFSASLQLNDNQTKGWGFWGNCLEEQFTQIYPPDINKGLFAIACYMNACKHQNESKARKHIAKVIWLLTYDNKQNVLSEAVDKYHSGIPPSHWLPWVPQLLNSLTRKEGVHMVNILLQIAKLYPQAIYFPVRTLYHTMKIQHRGRARDKLDQGVSDQGTPAGNIQVKASPGMVLVSKIMQLQRDVHPTLLMTMEGIVEQLSLFREHWSEEVLRHLRLILAKSYTVAFEHRFSTHETEISPSILNFMNKLIATFGTGVETHSHLLTNVGSESLARWTQMTMQDPVWQKMKVDFARDFDFNASGSKNLRNFIAKIRKWIKLMEKNVANLQKFYKIEETCRFLSNFNTQTADIEMPGEYLLSKHPAYCVKIARFMPLIEVVEKHNTRRKRLLIRGQNGKIYPYLMIIGSTMADSSREEVVLQLTRMLNHYLFKQKETMRRFLSFKVPKVVSISPQMRLVEDNVNSLSLLDIYKSICDDNDVPYDTSIVKYYDKLYSLLRANKPVDQALKELLADAQLLTPPHLLKHWAIDSYKSAPDLWTFRKRFTVQLALNCVMEYAFYLTRLNPDMLFIHRDTGVLSVSYYMFDIDFSTGTLNADRPVPFRLTPNLAMFITDIGVCGPFKATLIATANCFSCPRYHVVSLLRALIKDEFLKHFRREEDQDQEQGQEIRDASALQSESPPSVIKMILNAVDCIISRLGWLGYFDSTESKASIVIETAKKPEKLCQMDPTWHPWL